MDQKFAMLKGRLEAKMNDVRWKTAEDLQNLIRHVTGVQKSEEKTGRSLTMLQMSYMSLQFGIMIPMARRNVGSPSQ